LAFSEPPDTIGSECDQGINKYEDFHGVLMGKGWWKDTKGEFAVIVLFEYFVFREN
jgi:hypothetical protein